MESYEDFGVVLGVKHPTLRIIYLELVTLEKSLNELKKEVDEMESSLKAKKDNLKLMQNKYNTLWRDADLIKTNFIHEIGKANQLKSDKQSSMMDDAQQGY